MKRALSRWLLAFGQDRRGLAAVEFALIAPIMILIYFGMTEFSQAYMANRRANHTASIVADLVAQSETTSTQDLAKAFEIGSVIMRPFSAQTLSIRVTSLTMDSSGRAIIDWSKSQGTHLAPLTRGATVNDLPTGLIAPGESLIMGETHFVYESSAANVIGRPLNFTRSYYLRPRVVERVNCSDC